MLKYLFKSKIIYLLLSLLFIIIVIITLEIIKTKRINSNGDFVINDKYVISRTSRYQVSLKGENGIEPFVAKIGWNKECIVVVQYDLIEDDNPNSSYKIPDKNQKKYYIIDIKSNEKIGPLSKSEYKQYKCSKIMLFNVGFFH